MHVDKYLYLYVNYGTEVFTLFCILTSSRSPQLERILSTCLIVLFYRNNEKKWCIDQA